MIELLKQTPGSFSGALIIFWCFNVLLAGICLVIQNKPWSVRFDRFAYWVLAVALVSLAMFRPFGIAPDDTAYLNIYDSICPSWSCGKWIQGSRDWGWYSIIGLLKSLWVDPRILLVVSGVSTIIKMWVIFKLTNRPLWALLCFVPVFYLVQDLTALRVSLALAFFMLAIFWLSRSHRIIGFFMLSLSGLIHLQGMLSPIIIFASVLKNRYRVFVVLAGAPVMLILIGFNPMLYKENIISWDVLSVFPVLKHLVSSYTAITLTENYHKIRALPYSYIPFVLLVLCFSTEVFKNNRTLYNYCGVSFVIACWLLWIFAGWQEPQVRFFEYFALPTVLLVGNFRASWFQFLSLILVSGVFVVRYDVLHPFLIG